MKKKRGNAVGRALKIIGIIFIAAAFAVGAVYGSYADAFAAAAAVWLVGIAIGMGLFGMGEIIRLLQEMNRKMDEEKEKP